MHFFYHRQIDSRDNHRMQESIYARDLHVTVHNLSEKRYACNMNWPERYIIIQKYSGCYWYVIKTFYRIVQINIMLFTIPIFAPWIRDISKNSCFMFAR